LLFNARLIRAGYIHKFEVVVNGQPVFFEQDDMERYRAVVDVSATNTEFYVDKALLQAIAEAIEDILS
jgi:hypothetical protein